jgi:energy-coupling factor transporter ATP-binding protein EcfA2
MSVWESYPEDYRSREIQAILRAVRAGECVSVVGLSGSGKSNLLGFLGNCWPLPGEVDDIVFLLVDCNRLNQTEPENVFTTIKTIITEMTGEQETKGALADTIGAVLEKNNKKLCLMFDRFEILQQTNNPILYNKLRSLRDAYKYRLVYLLAGRKALTDENELAELFYAHTIWLGALSHSDSEWNVTGYAERLGERWDEGVSSVLIEISQGYPSMLRAVCEAFASMKSLDQEELVSHPAVQRRVREFWGDAPDDLGLKSSGLSDHPILTDHRPVEMDTSSLTAKEHALLNYLIEHPNVVCEKDDLIRAVWLEDEIFEYGIRDESLAQLVRRLRKKIEPDPSSPRYIQTVPGRGYRFVERD